MIKHNEVSGVSKSGNCIRTTTYRNVPLRQCPGCPMFSLVDDEGYCSFYKKSVQLGAFRSPDWCKIIEVSVKEQFE